MKTNNLKIVFDTNVLLVSISPHSQYHWIFEHLISGSFDLFITNEILMEYEEIIGERYNKQMVNDIFELLLALPNVYQIIPHFKWNLITADPDDNKFVDCFVASNAYCIVTHDKHFNILKQIDFPKIKICKIRYFRNKLFKNLKINE